MHLLLLPNELIRAICETFDDTQDIIRLSKCCKVLYTVTAPVLYSQFIQTGPDANIRTLMFMRTLVSKPYLSQHVKSLVATGITWRQGPTSLTTKQEEDCARISNLVMKFCRAERGFPELNAEHWQSMFARARLDAMTSLLLYILPSLSYINLTNFTHNESRVLGEINYGSSPRFMHKVVRRAARLQKPLFEQAPSPCALARLKKIRLEYSYNTHMLEFDRLMSFISLRSVRSFTAHGLVSLICSVPRVKNKPFNITKLALTESALAGNVFEDFLSHFPCLTVFQYHQGSAKKMNAKVMLIPQRIRNGLRHCSFFLEELLLIDHEENRQQKDWDGSMRPDAYLPMGYLSPFPRLRKLTISSYILIGRCEISNITNTLTPSQSRNVRIHFFLQSLPSHLEELTLLDCIAYDVWPLIDALLRNKRYYTPKLKSIRLDFQYGVIDSNLVVGPHRLAEWQSLYDLFEPETLCIEIDGAVVFPCVSSEQVMFSEHMQLAIRLDV